MNKNSLATWEAPINQFSLTPVWVPNNTSKKNAADVELAIDAMELLFTRQELAGFCIISSDSDFTGLVKRLRARGKEVLGIGEHKTPESFRNACTQFVYIENLPELEISSEESDNIFANLDDDSSIGEQSFDSLFIRAYEVSGQKTDGWVPLLDIKEALNALDPNFQSSEFQNTRQLAEKVKQLTESYPERILQVDERLDEKPVTHKIYVSDCDLFKFIEAYRNSSAVSYDGWLRLSIFLDEVRKYPAYENGFSYRGAKRLKAVKLMIQDYGEIIEMRGENDGNSDIHFLRVRL